MLETSIKDNTCIFQDLDECLVGGFYHGSDKSRAEKRIEELSQYESHLAAFGGGGGWSGSSRAYYSVFLRPGAWKHVDWCRNLVGEENYHILTNASADWAMMVNNIFDLGFPLGNIWSREDQRHRVAKFEGKNNILIDNENWEYHHRNSNKNYFLWDLPENKLFQVEDFYPEHGYREKIDDKDYVSTWREGIIKTINA